MEPIIGGILLGGFLAFNAFATPSRVEKTAEKSLRQKFPGALVNVDIEGKRGADVLKGRFKSVRVELSQVRFVGFPLEANASTPANATSKAVKTGSIEHLELRLRDLVFDDLAVTEATLSFDNVRYDFNALRKRSEVRLISFSNGKIALGLKAPALMPLFARRAPEILNPSVELQGGEAILGGDRPIFGTTAPVLVRGPIVARGQKLELDGARVEVGGLVLSPELAEPIIKDINPLYAFDPDGKWPLRLEIQTIRSDKNVLEFEGTLSMK